MAESDGRIVPGEYSSAEFLFPDTTKDFDKLPIQFKVSREREREGGGGGGGGTSKRKAKRKSSILVMRGRKKGSEMEVTESLSPSPPGLLWLHTSRPRQVPSPSQPPAGPPPPPRQVLRLLFH